jgi:hypothetical protein
LVSVTAPATGATEIATNLSITARFSQEMDPATVNATTFRLKQGATDVPGTVEYSQSTAVLTPAHPLAPDAKFTATLTVGCMNWMAVPLPAPYSWTFTTLGTGTQPDITATSPKNDAANVSTALTIGVTFNEPMDPATLTPSTFTVSQGRATIAGRVSYDAASQTATFTPAAPLSASLPYDAQVDVGAQSADGRGLVTPYSWSFTTCQPGLGPLSVAGLPR